MKTFSLFIAVLALTAASLAVYAADPASSPSSGAVTAPAADDSAERLKLSKDLHDIRNIRERINAVVLDAAKTLRPEDREDFQKYVQLHLDIDALEQKSIAYAAEVYTVDELRAMVAYFGSAAGQSAETKGEVFGAKIGKDIIAQVDAAILAAKYDGVPETSLPKIKDK